MRVLQQRLVEAEEGLVPQLGQDPPLSKLYGVLNLRFVLRLVRPRRHHSGAVMGGHVAIGPVDLWIVETRLDNPGFEIVRDDHPRHAAEEGEGADVAGDPIWQRLRPAGLDIGVVRRAKRCDEDLCGSDLASLWADYIDGELCPKVGDGLR